MLLIGDQVKIKENIPVGYINSERILFATEMRKFLGCNVTILEQVTTGTGAKGYRIVEDRRYVFTTDMFDEESVITLQLRRQLEELLDDPFAHLRVSTPRHTAEDEVQELKKAVQVLQAEVEQLKAHIQVQNRGTTRKVVHVKDDQ